MKKLLSLLMLLVALGAFPIALTGCGGGESSTEVETPSDVPDEDPNAESDNE